MYYPQLNILIFWQELKGKKDKEFVVVVLTTRWKGNVKQEVRNFCLESRETSISQIQVNFSSKSVHMAPQLMTRFTLIADLGNE